jgi:transcriptional regulator with XRE-family HTH domain
MTVTDKTVVASDDDEQEEAARVAYARAVGSRLRAMRKQMRLSLQAVEAMSEQEFKASVLGAYERGERAISVPRLQRLAKLYDVPVDQLLPPDDATMTRWGASGTTEIGRAHV